MGRSQGQQEKIPSKKKKIAIAKQNKTEVEFVNKIFPFIVAAMVGAFLIAIVLLFIKASAGPAVPAASSPAAQFPQSAEF